MLDAARRRWTSSTNAVLLAAPGVTLAQVHWWQDIAILDLEYAPAYVEVAPGTAVTWTNTGNRGLLVASHTVTTWQAPDNGFDSGVIPPYSSFREILWIEGRYSYACQIHPVMKGEIVVKANPS